MGLGDRRTWPTKVKLSVFLATIFSKVEKVPTHHHNTQQQSVK